ncbi:protein kinase-like protein [Micromonospora endolithica]|nr:protein kinase-like protein [Micromonospora endolithica]
MGRVWLARDELLDREVAVKEMLFRVGLTDGEVADLRRKMLREARAAARLDHPHVVRVYDVILLEERPWIVMEYVPSRSLHRLLTDEGPLPPRTVARLGVELVEALRAAHRVGVLHRDVTPRNVLIADDGRALLGDFGIAVVQGAAAVSQSWGITASPQYVAPERVRDNVSSPATDLWAVGATLYAAVEGRPPYARNTVVETLLALATDPPDRMRRAGPLTPVIAGLLRRDARRRMNAVEVLRRLRRIAGPAGAARVATARRGRGAPEVDAHTTTPTLPAGTSVTHVRGDAGATQVLPAADSTPILPAGDTTQVLADPGATQVLPPAGDATQRLPTVDDAATWVRLRDRGSASPVVRRNSVGRRSAGTFAVAVLALAGVLGVSAVGVRAALGGLYDAVSGPSGGAAGVTAEPSVTVEPTPLVPAVPCVAAEASERTPLSSAVAPDEAFALPAGWSWYADETGFTVGLPQGWVRFRDGEAVCLQDPSQERLLAVDLGGTQQRDPGGYWRTEADRLVKAGGLPGYVKVSIGPVIRPGGAAEWEFTWDGPAGQRQHARRLLVNGTTPGGAYELSWVTTDAGWQASEAVQRLVLASFRPAG